jgi:hypothetical protein
MLTFAPAQTASKPMFLAAFSTSRVSSSCYLHMSHIKSKSHIQMPGCPAAPKPINHFFQAKQLRIMT